MKDNKPKYKCLIIDQDFQKDFTSYCLRYNHVKLIDIEELNKFEEYRSLTFEQKKRIILLDDINKFKNSISERRNKK